MSGYDSILSAASQLPIADQLRLIDELAAAVPDDQPPSLSKEWFEEAERRSVEIESGAVETIPWEEVRPGLLKRAGMEELKISVLCKHCRDVLRRFIALTPIQWRRLKT